MFIDKYVADQANIEESSQSADVFASRDLETIHSSKKKVQVALFFPFSGKHRDLGWALYNSALMSIFDNDINHNIELVLIDSKDNPVEASQAFKEIINRNIKIVIGPVFSNFVDATKKNILKHSIKTISLSNNQELAGNIDNKGAVFIAGFLPEQQIDRVVSFSLDQEKNNFAILAPNNTYGIKISSMLKDTVARRDGNLVQSELYNSLSDKELSKAVERIVNAFWIPSKLAEGGGNKLDKKFRINQSDKNYAQVIFVPESAKTLGKINKLVSEFNKDEREIQVVGIGGSDDISTLNDANLNDVWFAGPDYKNFTSFEKSYYQIYNKFPPRIASIVYDSVASVSQVIDKSGSTNPSVKDFVKFETNNSLGFEGIDGKFRFLENGLTQRNLSILKVNSGEFEVIDPANEKFLNY